MRVRVALGMLFWGRMMVAGRWVVVGAAPAAVEYQRMQAESAERERGAFDFPWQLITW